MRDWFNWPMGSMHFHTTIFPLHLHQCPCRLHRTTKAVLLRHLHFYQWWTSSNGSGWHDKICSAAKSKIVFTLLMLKEALMIFPKEQPVHKKAESASSEKKIGFSFTKPITGLINKLENRTNLSSLSWTYQQNFQNRKWKKETSFAFKFPNRKRGERVCRRSIEKKFSCSFHLTKQTTKKKFKN